MDKKSKSFSITEKISRFIPDPVIIFVILYALLLLVSLLLGGRVFSIISHDGTSTTYNFRYMFTSENIRWVFSNAILNNWLAYGGGMLGIILVVMLGIGVAEESGLLSALIRKLGSMVPKWSLPYMIIFIGIMSNIATDVGYLVLIPLAGMLYAGVGKNPLVGMATAFAGVSAGFSANLIPATFVDVVMGVNARSFALSQGIPFLSASGQPLTPATMNYYFMVASTILLVLIGGLTTTRLTEKKYAHTNFKIPEDQENLNVTTEEKRGLKFALIGFLLSVAFVILLSIFPLRSYINSEGTKVTPYIDNVILLITFIFFVSGAFYGFAVKKFTNASDMVTAMANQMGSMRYVIVLTFFCYNFLALLSYTNADIFITGAGVSFLRSIGISGSPILLILATILVTSVVNLFVGGMTSKWMLLGPLFIPMLYNVNQSMTPDVVSAAYRVADSCTNIITPLMTYAGVILMYMRKYKDDFSAGDLISMMAPYSAFFLLGWSILLILFVVFKIPLGF